MRESIRESTIQQRIRKALGLEPGLVLWRNTTGHTVEFDERGQPRHINYGLAPGSADLVGCLDGRFVALEVKCPGELQSTAQILWAEQVRYNGGFYAVVHDDTEARAAIARARLGERA